MSHDGDGASGLEPPALLQALVSGLECLHIHQAVVEGRPAPQVGQCLAGELVYIAAVHAELAPPDAHAVDPARAGALARLGLVR